MALQQANHLQSDSIRLYALRTCVQAYLNKPYAEDSALVYIPEIENLLTRNKFYTLHISCCQTVASYYTFLHRYDDAIRFVQLGLDIAKSNGTITQQSQMRIAEGEIYRKSNAFDFAKLAFTEAGRLAVIDNNSQNQISANRGLGICYDMTKDYQNAEKYFGLALQAALLDSNEKMHHGSLGNYAVAKMHLDKYDEAIVYFKWAVRLAEKYFKPKLITEYKNLADVYLKKKACDSSLYYGNLSLQIAIERNEKLMQTIVYELLDEASSCLGNYQDAYKYAKLGSMVSDTLKAKEKDNAIAKAIATYKYKEQVAEINLLNADKNLQQLKLKQQQNELELANLYNLKSADAIKILNQDKAISDLKLHENEINMHAQTLKITNTSIALKLAQNEQDLQRATLKAEKQLRFIMLGIAVILLLAAIMFFNRYRFKQKLAQQHALINQRKHISADLHDDIGATLSSINIYSEAIKNKLKQNETNKVMDLVDKIGDNARDTITSLSDMVWSINPSNDAANMLFERMQNFAIPLLASKNIDMEFEYNQSLQQQLFSMEVKQNVFLIFKEIVNNIAKYSKASQVLVRIESANPFMVLKIIENGVGFDTSKTYAGNGLRNMKLRANEINCNLSCQSTAGFTQYILDIPLAD
ncbi:MAG: hypothetical protein JNK61_04175 [Bacteroidia bacterium]|nr:hypothetical protein [Bacteroidia bacterium]